jgi:hypothetical protein
MVSILVKWFAVKTTELSGMFVSPEIFMWDLEKPENVLRV